MSAQIGAAVLALLKAKRAEIVAVGGIFGVYDGYVSDSDESTKTISAPLPYCVFYPRAWYPAATSLAGPASAEVSEFRVGFSGGDRRQASWAGDHIMAALADVRLTDVPGDPVIRWSESMDPTTDPVWSRVGGGRLAYGFHEFSVCY